MEEPPSPSLPGIDATIHLGASSISMLVFEREDPSRIIEFLEQPFPLARDVFSEGRVGRTTTERAVTVLRGYLEGLAELGLGPKDLSRIVATNILSEAEGFEIFLNRLQIACGLEVEILDDGEMTRLIYLKTRRRIRETPSMKRRTTLVTHVGPGNTRVILFRKGRIVRYTSYRLGTHRAAEALDEVDADGPELLRLIREHTSGHIGQMLFDYEGEEIEDLGAIGYEIQLLTPFLPARDESRVNLKSVGKLSREASGMSRDDRVRNYQLDYHTAEAVIPALEINVAIAEAFDLKGLRIPGSDFERGLLADLPVSSQLSSGFWSEVVRSARIIAKKYKSHGKHGDHIAFLCARIFEQTRDLHQLDDYDGQLLEIAAILHEVGGFVSPKAHHKHSQYLIENSEIFGLARHDVQIVALIARYHRHSGPRLTHPAYAALSTRDRIRVSKLAAILRVADALERTHTQRISDVNVSLENSRIVLGLVGVTDAAVERLALVSKGDLFHDVFGLPVILQEHAP